MRFREALYDADRRSGMKKKLLAVLGAALLAGCATNQVAETNVAAAEQKAQYDQRIIRGLLDSMAAQSVPVNIPR